MQELIIRVILGFAKHFIRTAVQGETNDLAEYENAKRDAIWELNSEERAKVDVRVQKETAAKVVQLQPEIDAALGKSPNGEDIANWVARHEAEIIFTEYRKLLESEGEYGLDGTAYLAGRDASRLAAGFVAKSDKNRIENLTFDLSYSMVEEFYKTEFPNLDEYRSKLESHANSITELFSRISHLVRTADTPRSKVSETWHSALYGAILELESLSYQLDALAPPDYLSPENMYTSLLGLWREHHDHVTQALKALLASYENGLRGTDEFASHMRIANLKYDASVQFGRAVKIMFDSDQKGWTAPA